MHTRQQERLSADTGVQADNRTESSLPSATLGMLLPTGHTEKKVLELLDQIGINFKATSRSYRPTCSDSAIEAKFLKAQNIPGLVGLGRHDCGFSGYDWIVEQGADVVELLDLGFDPVRIIAAVPEDLVSQLENRRKDKARPLVVASEYRNLALDYIARTGNNAVYVQAFGATESLPPEDADIIIDNTASGATLKANRLVIIEELMRSSTRFFCNKTALANPQKKQKLEEMTMLMKSTILAREKVMLEMNVSNEDFDRVIKDLPCMRAPTVSQLYNGEGYVIKIAVPVKQVPQLIPQLVASGAKDILEYKLEKIVV